MKKNNNKSLNDYFEAARAQEPPMQLQDIYNELEQVNQTGAIGKSVPKASVSITKIAAVSAGVISILAVGLWLLKPTSEPTPAQEQIPITTEQTEPPEHATAAGEQQRAGKADEQIPTPNATSPAQKESPFGEERPVEAELAPKQSETVANITKSKTAVNAREMGTVLAEELKFVSLPADVLNQLGFWVNADGIHFEMYFNDKETKGKAHLGEFHISYQYVAVVIIEDTLRINAYFRKFSGPPIKPIFITDRQGQGLIKYRTATENPQKLEPAYFNRVVNSLIPVLVQAGNAQQDEAVFWFEPSAEFLKELPPAMAHEIGREYQLMMQAQQPQAQDSLKAIAQQAPNSGQQPSQADSNKAAADPDNVRSTAKSAHKYFEAGQTGLSTTEQFSLYPNPAFEQVHLSLILKQPDKLRISLASIGGRVLKVLSPMQSYAAGPLQQVYPLRNLPPGIYVLVIESASGGKLTQRLIIQ